METYVRPISFSSSGMDSGAGVHGANEEVAGGLEKDDSAANPTRTIPRMCVHRMSFPPPNCNKIAKSDIHQLREAIPD